MNTIVQLYRFLIDLHHHPATMGARLVFVTVGTIMFFQGIVVIYGCFVPALRVQDRAWWQRAFPPPVPKPYSYPVRTLYVVLGVFSVALGAAFLYEILV